MEFEQQAFVPDEQMVKQREELKKMIDEKSFKVVRPYEPEEIKNDCKLSLESVKDKSRELWC